MKNAMTRTALTADDKSFLEANLIEVRRQLVRTYQDVTGKEVPLPGGRIEITGVMTHDMYDGAPGMAYFTRDASQVLDVPCFQTVEEVKAFAMARFITHQVAATPSTPYDGMFTPHAISIKDPAGRLLALYAYGAWADLSIPPEEWAATEVEIERLREQASSETFRRNHRSAGALRKQATRLELSLSLSQERLELRHAA